jgi:hypothetical protein
MRMSASRALRKWDRINARPAASAHDALIAWANGSLAHDATLGQKQIGERGRRSNDASSHVQRHEAIDNTGQPHDSPRDGLAHCLAIRSDTEPSLEGERALLKQHRESVCSGVTARTRGAYERRLVSPEHEVENHGIFFDAIEIDRDRMAIKAHGRGVHHELGASQRVVQIDHASTDADACA